MPLWAPQPCPLGPDPAAWEQQFGHVPDAPGVYLISISSGAPYAGRTAHLRRRLTRLLGWRPHPSLFLNLREVATGVQWQRTASRLETSLLFYELARVCYPQDYARRIRFRMPAYLKIILSNPFPRAQITARLSGSFSLSYGPFRTRASAERFEAEFLDLFQMRRCQEDLAPSPDHPGCIYGEMNLCLRPCQQVVTREEYGAEIDRVVRFLSSGGRSLLDPTLRARDRASEELDFEQAARLHKQVEKIESVLKLRDELATDLDHLSGVAVTPSVAPDCVELWFLLRGWWQPPVRFSLTQESGRPVSLDERLREVTSSLRPYAGTVQERQEHLALLAQWWYSSYCDGVWLAFPNLSELPYRKLVRAISKVAARSSAPQLGQVSAPGGEASVR